jgi:hypothetical protein
MEHDEPPIEFIHIPQTGGEAIERAYPEFKWGSMRFPSFSLSHRSSCHNLLVLRPMFAHKICFGVLRNPFDRILEVYKQWQFPDNSQVFNETLEKWANDLPTIPYLLDNNLRPQVELLNLCKYIILYDPFIQTNLYQLFEEVGIPKRLLMSEDQKMRYYKVNRHSFSPSNKKWIESFYKDDFELFEKVKMADGFYKK